MSMQEKPPTGIAPPIIHPDAVYQTNPQVDRFPAGATQNNAYVDPAQNYGHNHAEFGNMNSVTNPNNRSPNRVFHSPPASTVYSPPPRHHKSLENGDGAFQDPMAAPERQLVSPTEYARAQHIPGGSYANQLAKFRFYAKEPLAEFLGTMVFLIFAYGAGAQFVLGTDPALSQLPKSDPAANALGWGTGIAFGVWIAGGISGAHLNPAVTLSQAVFRKMPWRKVPGYMTAQLLGAIAATLIVYGNYRQVIYRYDPGKTSASASIFATYPVEFLPFGTAWYSEFVGTALLCGFVAAITDKNNNPPGKGMVALALWIFFVGITITWGWLTAFAINPARDLGPRIALSFVGYGSHGVWTEFHWWWISGVIPADFTGGLFGVLIYDIFVFVGGESPVNSSDRDWKSRGLKLGRGARAKGPAGISERDAHVE